MTGNASDPVRLDHYQNIIEVGWPSRKKYLITTARFDIDIPACTEDQEFGDDGIVYPVVPAGQGSIWTTAVGIRYWPISTTGRYNRFDVYDADGDFVESLTDVEISASLPLVPATTSFPRFECFITIGVSTITNLDWGSVGADVDPLFPGYKTGSAILNFPNGFDYSGAEEKYSPGPIPSTSWWKWRAKSSVATSKALTDVTIASATYGGHAYLPIGVKLTEGSLLGNDFLQAEVLLQRQ